MSFYLEDGRTAFYQWDIDRKLIVSDPTVTEVHFCNKTDDCSLVCEVYEEDGARLVNVPNILLQEVWSIRAYAYCNNCYTKQSAIFKVNARSKPADYVYTETEVKRWESLEARVTNLEQNGGGGTGGGGSHECTKEIYVGNTEPEDDVLVWINPDEETTADLATKTYVDEAIANIDIPESSGDGIKTLVFNIGNYGSNMPHQAELEEILALGDEAKIAEKYRIFIDTGGAVYECTSFLFRGGILYVRGSYENEGEKYTYTVTAQYQGSALYYLTVTFADISSAGGSGGSDWTITDELYGDNIYNAKEIFIRMQAGSNSKWVFSHFICNPAFNETIGTGYQSTDIAFATPDGMDNSTPYWNFDGWNLNITCDGGYSNVLVAYKL